jgi:hypothetical protein
MKMNMKFYDAVVPHLEEELKNIGEGYDDVMVSLISFVSTTLIEKTINMVNDKKIPMDQFEPYLDRQLKRTVGSIIESTDRLLDAYVVRLNEMRETVEEEEEDDAFSNIHPTVQ